MKRNCFLNFFVAFLLLVGGVSQALAQIEITDSHGKYRFSEPPKRVVVLNWALAEQLIELGERPVGMADVEGFRRHANTPKIPGDVVDVGLRLSPDLNKVKSLKPDIIMIGYSQRPLIRPLSNIATVIYFKNFGKRYNNYEKARSRFFEIAKLFNKSELAKEKMRAQDQELLFIKRSLKESFADSTLPAVQFLVPTADRKNKAWVFGENSLPFYAAQEIGISVVGPNKKGNDKFGSATLSFDEVNSLIALADTPVCQLFLSSYSSQESVDRKGSGDAHCAYELSYQNAFGGVRSVLYLARAIHDSLVNREKTSQK